MKLLDAMLTSLVDSAFPIAGDRPDDPDCPLLNPIVHRQRETEGGYDK